MVRNINNELGEVERICEDTKSIQFAVDNLQHVKRLLPLLDHECNQSDVSSGLIRAEEELRTLVALTEQETEELGALLEAYEKLVIIFKIKCLMFNDYHPKLY